MCLWGGSDYEGFIFSYGGQIVPTVEAVLAKQDPRAVKCLQRDFERLIAVFSFPQELRKMLRTTNVIERCFREVRRRLKVMGYFQNSKSCDRIVYALFAYFNKKWLQSKRRLPQVKTLTTKAA